MNSEYWENRLANVVWNSYNTLEEENIALLDHYSKAMNSIRAELMKLEEQTALSRSDRYRVQHLKSIQEQILKECEKLGDSVENDIIKNVSKQMQDIYKTSFSNISDDKFSQLSKNACKDIINTPWQGSSFSERLWSNTGKLANDLNSILSNGITEGKTIAEMAFQLSNRMNKDMNACHRLVRTETINSLNRASMRGMIDAGIKYVRWWAAEDERMCEICGANHGKVYPIDKAPNLPCHPGCRCTWLPVFEDELTPLDVQSVYNLTDQELYATNKYVAGDFNVINDSLRRGFNLESDELALLEDLDKALDKFPNYEGRVTRSLYFYTQDHLDSFVNSHVIGLEHVYPEYIATTKGKIYNPDSHVEIIIENSKKGKDISLLNWKEQEVLYTRENVFIPVDIIVKDDKIYIYLEEA